MKLPLIPLIAFLAAPVLADDWQCNGNWNDGGLKRLSFTFNGYCEDRYGQCFLDALRRHSLTVHNWQCWKRGDGKWQVDFSTTAGIAWSANQAIETVTNTWRGCWPNQLLAEPVGGASKSTIPHDLHAGAGFKIHWRRMWPVGRREK